MTFIDAERETYGVEPMGAVLPIAPATYFRHKAWQAHPDQRCPRARRDAWLTTQIQRVWDENVCVYGPRKVWQQLIREGITVARCTVERLMRHMGLHGAVRGSGRREGYPSRPPTPPCVRFRTRRFKCSAADPGVECNVWVCGPIGSVLAGAV